MRELPVYVLTIAKNGPKLKQTSPGGELSKALEGSVFESHGIEGINTVPMPDGSRRTQLKFQATSMEETARTFSFYLHRQVLARTGLKRDYDFTLEYEDDSDARVALNPFSGLTPSSLSKVLAAVGLKLQSTKAAAEVPSDRPRGKAVAKLTRRDRK
jgi:uncharacterized protein (TIGR03435 family)